MSISDEQALRDAIIADPENDIPRFVFADWLQERGRDERAELIRVQCRAAALEEWNPAVGDLETQAEDLLAEHELCWLGPWADRLVDWRFRRGFLDEATLTPTAFLQFGEHLFDWEPVRQVRFVSEEGDPIDPEVVPELIAHPAFRRVRSLNANGGPDPLIGAWIQAIAEAKHLNGLNQLDLTPDLGPIQDGLPSILNLAGPSHLVHLQRLITRSSDSMRCGWTDAQLDVLANAPFAKTLEALSLGWFSDEAPLRRFCSGVDFPRLRELTVGAMALGASPLLRFPDRLQRLNLTNTNPAIFDASAVRLTHLAVNDGPGTPLVPWLESSICERLVRFEVSYVPEGDQMVDALLRGAASRSIRELCLGPAHLTSEAVNTLANSEMMERLTALYLGSNPVGLGIRSVLNSSHHTDRLRELGVNVHDSNPNLVTEVAACSHLRRLTHLAINVTTPEQMNCLVESAHLRRLTTLHLDWDAPTSALDVLLRADAFPRLRNLNLWIDPTTPLDRLREQFGARLRILR